MKLSIPALPVTNIPESVAFYTTKFGFTCRHHSPEFCILERDAVEIHLWRSGDERWRSRDHASWSSPIVSGAESFLAGTASCRIEVQGIDDLFAELRETGVIYRPDTRVELMPWGNKEFPALDHHRNLLTFFERPPADGR